VYIYGSYRKIKTELSLFWTTLYIAMEKAFSICGKAEWRTYSAHFLLIS